MSCGMGNIVEKREPLDTESSGGTGLYGYSDFSEGCL